jgi:hypothetical protein
MYGLLEWVKDRVHRLRYQPIPWPESAEVHVAVTVHWLDGTTSYDDRTVRASPLYRKLSSTSRFYKDVFEFQTARLGQLCMRTILWHRYGRFNHDTPKQRPITCP